jgi:large subunit ribosomal protein L35
MVLLPCERKLEKLEFSHAQVEDEPGAAKRFRKTASTGFKSYSAGRRHILGQEELASVKRKLRSGGSSLVHKSDVGRAIALLPNA